MFALAMANNATLIVVGSTFVRSMVLENQRYGKCSVVIDIYRLTSSAAAKFGHGDLLQPGQ